MENIKITSADIEREYQRRKYNKLELMFPDSGPFARSGYEKHLEFFASGNKYREKLFRAANRCGKTEAGAYEVALHLTGLYPVWWQGKRFSNPINALVAGETGKLVRDSLQEKMLGPLGDKGSGMIPKNLIESTRPRHGTPDAVDIAQIKHISGGISILQFQSYDQGREAFQATARHVIWLDEEPPLSVYSEALTRTMTTQGIVMTTFTPLKGMSETVMFLEKKYQDGKIALITADWSNAPHLEEKDKEEMLAAYPPHQRDARSKGIPSMGSGVIYPVPMEDYVVPDFAMPKHARYCYGMDVGWNATAIVFGAYDGDSDTWYIIGDYKRGQQEPSVHAAAIRMRAKGIGQPGVIDPAANGRSQKDGDQLMVEYRDLGLNITPANNAIESGITAVWIALSTGRLKVFSSCTKLLDEMRVFRRDERGKIVKQDIHLCDGLRYLIMSGESVAKSIDPKKKKSSGFTRTIGSWMST